MEIIDDADSRSREAVSVIVEPPTRIGLAALMMVTGSLLFVLIGGLLKQASGEATPMQGVFFRSLFALVPLLVIMRVQRLPVMSTQWPLLLARGAFGFLALAFYVWALTHVPLVDVMALQQMAPVFVTILAMALLGERPKHRVLALSAVCFLGALLVIRPTRGVASIASSAALVSSVFSSLAYTSIRKLTATEPTSRIVTWFALLSTVLSAPFALGSWHPLHVTSWGMLALAGLLAVPGQWLMTGAYRYAPAHMVAVFAYTSVPMSYLAGWTFWDEQVHPVGAFGMVAIIAGGVGAAWSGKHK